MAGRGEAAKGTDNKDGLGPDHMKTRSKVLGDSPLFKEVKPLALLKISATNLQDSLIDSFVVLDSYVKTLSADDASTNMKIQM